jgi:tetratricopeptide (TPR) repeat protein
MLETLREYALERLTERGEATAARHAHAAYAQELAERAASWLHGPEQVAWLDRLDEEHANLQVALAWLLDQGQAGGALRLAVALYHFWFVRGYFDEGLGWFERVLQAATPASDGPPTRRRPDEARLIAWTRFAAAHFTLVRGELVAAREQAVALLADMRSSGAALSSDHETRNLMVRILVLLLQAEGTLHNRPDQSLVDEAIALAEATDDPSIAAIHALSFGRGMLYGAGRPDLARPLVTRAERLYRQLGDIYPLAMVMVDLGMLAMLAGDLVEAARCFNEACASAVALRDRFLEAEALNNLGELARLTGDDEAAERHYQTSLKLHRDLGTQVEPLRLLHNLGYLALHRDETALARERFAESLTGFRAVGQVRGQVEAMAGLAAVAAAGGTLAPARAAARLWGAADADRATMLTGPWPPDRAERARYEPLARTVLGDAAYVAAYAAGAALTLEAATDEALRQ